MSEVKIDRGFVSGMRAGATDREIVRAAIMLARNLGLSAVAEGVEDQETWQALRDLGCTLIQGYHLARPLPADEVEAFLDKPREQPPRSRNLLKTAS